MTCGTGKKIQSQSDWLMPSHSYAVLGESLQTCVARIRSRFGLDIREEDGNRYVELMNPWRSFEPGLYEESCERCECLRRTSWL